MTMVGRRWHCTGGGGTSDAAMIESMSPSDFFVTTKAAEQRLPLFSLFDSPGGAARPLRPALLSKCGHAYESGIGTRVSRELR